MVAYGLQRGIGDAELALPRFAAQKGDRDRDFVRGEAAQAVREFPYLRQTAGRLRDALRGGDDVGKQRHARETNSLPAM